MPEAGRNFYFSRIRWIIPLLVLAVTITVLIPTRNALADDNYYIKINSPADGSDVGSVVTISASYLANGNAGQYPKPTRDMPWEVLFTAILGGSSSDGSVLDSTVLITDVSGGASATFNLGNNTGYWTFEAELMQPAIPFGKSWAPAASSVVYLTYSSAGGIAGGQTPGTSGTSSSSGGGAGVVVPVIVVAGGAITAGVLINRSRKKNKQVSKKPVAKPPVQSDKNIADASKKYSEALRNKERFDKFSNLRNIVSGDSRLLDFVDSARSGIIDKNGNVDADKLARLESDLQRWIIRDKLAPQTPDYTYQDAYFNTVSQASKNIIIRGGMAYLTGGYSEMALCPVSAVSTMRENINEDKSTLRAVAGGFGQAGFELSLGEAGRLVKYAQPAINNLKESYALSKLSGMNADLASEVSTINQLAKQSDMAKYSRNAFMNSSEVTELGQSAAHSLDDLEQAALNLNNNPEFKELMAKNSDLIPANVKEVMGIAKQKAYEEARNKAIGDVVNQMSKDGVPAGENPLFLQQTGTHARPGNPGWNPLKSDFDHTVDFGSSDYNQLYEQQFNTHLEAQSTSATALDANVYGAGTSSRGAYSGGAMKFVQNYNQTTGSDVMIRAKDGIVTISREEPQQINSLLSQMNSQDIASAKDNYTQFFQKSLDKGGSVDNMLQNTSKEVSRKAGQYSVDYAQHFQNTGSVNYQVPQAAKVADLVKKQGFSVDGAMQKVGYTSGKTQLLNDYKKIMGL